MKPIYPGDDENSNKDYSIAEWVKEKGHQVVWSLTILDHKK